MIFNYFQLKIITKVREFVNEGLCAGNTLGCYIPLRALAYLSSIGIKDNLRFFDDDKGIYNQYFDGFPIPVENRIDLINNPVTHLLIMSSAFGEKIKKEIIEIHPTIKILTYDQVVK